MRKISILGCGWLGKAVGVRLLQDGFLVFGSTTQANKFAELEALNIKPCLINLSDESKAIEGDFFNCETLLVCIPPKLQSVGAENYLAQLKRLREVALMHPVRRIIFVSSTAVYPDLNRIVIESDADPSSVLVHAENIFRAEKEFHTTVLRFAGLVGPARHPGRFLAGKKDVGGGDNPVNIIHQEDCVSIIETIIRNNIQHEVFNACADFHPSKKDFYTRASHLLQLDPPQFSNDAAPFKIINSDKLKQSLAYEFKYPNPLAMFT